MISLADLSRQAREHRRRDAIRAILAKPPEKRTKREQRRLNNLAEKEHLKGRRVWDSARAGTCRILIDPEKNTPQDASPERQAASSSTGSQ